MGVKECVDFGEEGRKSERTKEAVRTENFRRIRDGGLTNADIKEAGAEFQLVRDRMTLIFDPRPDRSSK